MKSKKIVRTNTKRTVNTYSELWHTSNCLLRQGSLEKKDSYHQFSASLIFTAFTMEASLNHLGKKIFNCWKDLEYLSIEGKLNVIADKLSVSIEKDKRPWQIFKELFDYRNSLAHGKSEVIEDTQEVALHKYNHGGQPTEFIQTDWEKYCTKTNAERARKDVEKIVRILHKAAGLNENMCFLFGFQERQSTLVEGK